MTILLRRFKDGSVSRRQKPPRSSALRTLIPRGRAVGSDALIVGRRTAPLPGVCSIAGGRKFYLRSSEEEEEIALILIYRSVCPLGTGRPFRRRRTGKWILSLHPLPCPLRVKPRPSHILVPTVPMPVEPDPVWQ